MDNFLRDVEEKIQRRQGIDWEGKSLVFQDSDGDFIDVSDDDDLLTGVSYHRQFNSKMTLYIIDDQTLEMIQDELESNAGKSSQLWEEFKATPKVQEMDCGIGPEWV